MMTIRTCFSDLSFDLFSFCLFRLTYFFFGNVHQQQQQQLDCAPFKLIVIAPKRVRCVCIIFCEAFSSVSFSFCFFSPVNLRSASIVSGSLSHEPKIYLLAVIPLIFCFSLFWFQWPANLAVFFFIRDSSSCNFLQNLTVRRWRRFFLFFFWNLRWHPCNNRRSSVASLFIIHRLMLFIIPFVLFWLLLLLISSAQQQTSS